MKYRDKSSIKGATKYHEKKESKEEVYWGHPTSERQRKRRDASYLKQMMEFSYTLPDKLWWNSLDRYEKPEAYDTYLSKLSILAYWSKDYNANKVEAIKYMMKNHHPRPEVKREFIINEILKYE